MERARVGLVQAPAARNEVAEELEPVAADDLPTAIMHANDERTAVKLDSGARYTISGTEWMQRVERKRCAVPVDSIEGIGGFRLDVVGVCTFNMCNTFGQAVQLDACVVNGCRDEFLIGVDFLK
ncbi:unnamed protein product [Phytophthora fragariaefolia]|uniref:Unnamed protein product n=1 Tax=Phytophthora fragariaefolia TaxID=1490495 RepID=A0A9W6YCG0_9STRA|nr:unnamed protein product [Phytophthora fragariaefolia]